MDSYKHLSRIYDHFNAEINHKEWAEYLAGFFGFNAQKVVDIGCGTANIAIELKKRGYEVCGVDISQNMLEIAQENARKAGVKMPFIHQDICYLSLPSKADVITASCDVINYIEHGEIEELFTCVYDNLKDEGKFIFDISSKNKLVNTVGNNVFFEDDSDSTYIWNNEHLDNKIYMDLILFIKSGEMYKKLEESHIQYIYEARDLETLLYKNRFKCEIYDFMSKDKYHKDSDRIQFVCEKWC